MKENQPLQEKSLQKENGNRKLHISMEEKRISTQKMTLQSLENQILRDRKKFSDKNLEAYIQGQKTSHFGKFFIYGRITVLVITSSSTTIIGSSMMKSLVG